MSIDLEPLRISGDIKMGDAEDSDVLWGHILGQLSNQKDLAAALNEKADAAEVEGLEKWKSATEDDILRLTESVSKKAESSDLLSLSESVYQAVSGLHDDVQRVSGEVDKKASSSDLEALETVVSKKASASDLSALENTVSTKMETPAGNEGQFLVYRSGKWVGETLETWSGGSY